MEDIFGDKGLSFDQSIEEWVIGKCQEWEEHYEANYEEKHKEYMRLYRNQWSSEDKSRESERSKLIAPALAQAVESNVAEVEEATFGRGKLFGIKDNLGDEDSKDVRYLGRKLHEDFALARVRSAVAEVLVNAAVYGTGIGEVILEEHKTYTPGSRPIMDGDMQEIGVTESYRPLVKINPIQPRNFLIDPNATCIDEAMGCAIDEFVSEHIVQELQEAGVYRDDVHVTGAAADESIEADPELTHTPTGRVRLTKYYGKVPRDLLIESGVDEEDITEPGHYVEAIIVIANEGTLLKAIPNPYMCQDRPVVAFQWDIVPSTFWGRGVCEKGYMSQKALDAELRARIDALALTTHPMMAVDATRIPRGHKMEIRPGRMLLTNGAPGESIMPFNFGQLNAVTFQQGAALQQMVSQATGAADGSMAQVQNDVTAAGMSMSQGALIKRQKRTLVNFQENFLIPFIRKAAFRYMQFDPENYPVKDYTFTPYSSLGAMAREYEVNQLTQMLQMLPPDSPAHTAVVKAIIDHLNITNRGEIMDAIDAASQPNPEQQRAAMEAQQKQEQIQLAIAQGQVQLLNAQAAESQSRAQKYATETKLMPEELTFKYAEDMEEKEFQRKKQMSELLLKEQELQGMQDRRMEETKAKAEAELVKQLTSADQRSSQTPQNPTEEMNRGQ
jgi:hypothetical protein